MLNAGGAFELNQLLFGLLREADVPDCHDSPEIALLNPRRAEPFVKFEMIAAVVLKAARAMQNRLCLLCSPGFCPN